MFTYDFHGVHVRSEIPLELEPFRGGPGVRDLAIRRCPAGPHGFGAPIFTSPRTGYSLFAGGERELVLAGNQGFFRIRAGEIGVCFEEVTPEVRAYLLASAIGLWLELSEVPVLHAACVGIGAGAVGLMAHSGGGKSTLVTGLLGAGCSLLSDDLLPLHAAAGAFEARPSVATTRLWPDAAERLVGDAEALEPVVPRSRKRKLPAATFGAAAVCSEARPLTALYLLERERGAPPDAIRIEALAPRDAFLTLIAHSYLGEMVELLPLRASRLSPLGQAARTVPVRRVVYPSGFEHLPAVSQALVADAMGLAR